MKKLYAVVTEEDKILEMLHKAKPFWWVKQNETKENKNAKTKKTS